MQAPPRCVVTLVRDAVRLDQSLASYSWEAYTAALVGLCGRLAGALKQHTLATALPLDEAAAPAALGGAQLVA